MSAITKCCCFCAHYGRGECRLFFNKPTKVDPGTAACKDWTFPFTELIASAQDSLIKARDKHPDFIPSPEKNYARIYTEIARELKDKGGHEGYSTLCSILMSECYEFLTEIAKGDLAAATTEAGDVMAVLYRALNGDGKQEDKS